jgi:hypothetical protein
MKPKSIKSLLALALLAPGVLFAQTTAKTTPVGYVTEVLEPNRDNLIGLTVHSPAVASGVLDSATNETVTDAGVDYTSLLTAGSTYILEITNGSGNGVIQEVTAWTATTLSTPQNISSQITGGTTTYKLRKAPTISDIFGSTNSVGLTSSPDGSASAADVILVPDGAGGFINIVFYDDGADQLWIDASFNDVSNLPIVYTDALVVARKGGVAKSLTVSGEVKLTPTKYVFNSGDNYVGAVYPVGSTLGGSTMGPQMLASVDGSAGDADLVLMPDGAGGYTTFMYYNDGADQLWIDGSFNDSTTTSLTSGFVFNSKSGSAKSITNNPASFYSTL